MNQISKNACNRTTYINMQNHKHSNPFRCLPIFNPVLSEILCYERSTTGDGIVP